MMDKKSETIFIVAGCKSWIRLVYDEVISHYPGKWSFASNPGQLNDILIDTQPKYIFFLHWSWGVPSEIVKQYECICFHMSDVPYGRGGSPLQNLIIKGHRKTKLTSLKMVEELDAGPVYFKEDLSLEGSAEEIYIRATYLSASMIRRIIEERPQPIPQEGAPVIFKRRKPVESQIPKFTDELALYDFIRMLDAEDYPHAYLEHEGFHYEFRRAAFYNGRIVADVAISLMKKEEDE